MTPWQHVSDVLDVFLSPSATKYDALRVQVQKSEFQKFFSQAIAPQIFRHGLVGIYHEVFKEMDFKQDALTDMVSRQVKVQVNLLQLQEGALRLIQNENIPCVVLKGLSLAERLYGNIALRPSSDVDILVSEKNRTPCLAAFLGNGFVETRAIPGHFHTTLKHPDFLGVIELHHGLGDRVFPFDVDGMLARTRNNILDATDELLYLAYHAGRNYFVFRLVLLVDLFLAVRKWQEQIAWDTLLDRAKEARVYGLVTGALGCCRELLGIRENKLDFGREGLVPAVSGKIVKWCLHPDPIASRVQHDAWVRRALFWSCLDSWEDQIRFFLQRALP